jgi:murein L,D-transpeptidase YcbB/YkuD
VSFLINKGTAALIFVIVILCTNSDASEINSYIPIPDTEVALHIKERISRGIAYSKKTIWGEQVYSAVLVESFYKGRNCQPAWSHDGHLMQVEMLMKAVDEAYGDGLSPAYYHLARIRSLVDNTGGELSPCPNRLADLDILLTDAFITLGCHLSAGCVNPVAVASEWFAKGGKVDVSSLLEQALKKKQIREALIGLRPEKGIYTRLRSALAHYRELALKGEWPLLSGGPSMKKGFKYDGVVELRKRLAASGDLRADEAIGGSIFDDRLEQSLILFQKRHGLKADGVVGRDTRNALNVPLKQRIHQMELNMERLRWILGILEERFIIVNIADFQLSLIEKDKPILSMKVVVGKPYQSTPIFTAKMTYIVINPSWNIPDSIARKEILKKIVKNPLYLAEQNIEVLEGRGPRERGIEPDTIDWSKVTGQPLRYRFRQKPGSLNALGQLKFMLPNSYDIYLHDTPAKRLFSENVRTFSHGCIRVEKPIELAEYMLRDDLRWTRDALIAAMDKGTEQVVQIPQPVNVHFLYLTAWVDEGDTLQFRNDIYGRDKLLDEALRKKPYIQ